MDNLLLTLRDEFSNKLNNLKIIDRRINLKPLPNKVSVFIGMRRTGKTTFVFEQIKHLLKKGIELSQILYINFEDDRLQEPNNAILTHLVDEFYRLFPQNHDRQCYFFFDEIQNVSNWPKIIRRFFDTKKVEILLTGSSAKLLSKEIGTSLRGRSLATEIWPFDFHEFLSGKEESFPTVPLSKKSYDKFYTQFQEYLHFGGFPETLHFTHEDFNRLLQDYVNVVVMRDIVERYNITNITLIRYIIKSLIKSVGSPFSVNKFFNDIKSQGIAASKNTLYEYLQYIEDAYLLFTVPIFSESIRKMHANPKKIYAVDMGLINAYTLALTPNYEHLFENLIYLDLRRKNHEIFYYVTKQGYEIDFVSRDPKGKLYIWQIAWDISNKNTIDREQRALDAAEKELNIAGNLVTPESYIQFLHSLER